LFINFAHVLGLFFFWRPLDAGDVEPFLSPFGIKDALDPPGQLDRLIRHSQAFFQNPVTYFFSKAT
jgi:hypothetical protein